MFFCYLLETCSLLMRDRKGEDLEGREGDRELGGMEGWETVTSMYCMSIESIFIERGK